MVLSSKRQQNSNLQHQFIGNSIITTDNLAEIV